MSLGGRPANVASCGLSLMQKGRFVCRLTLSLPPDLQGGLILEQSKPAAQLPLEDAPDGVYSRLFIPNGLYEELLPQLVVYGEERVLSKRTGKTSAWLDRVWPERIIYMPTRVLQTLLSKSEVPLTDITEPHPHMMQLSSGTVKYFV